MLVLRIGCHIKTTSSCYSPKISFNCCFSDLKTGYILKEEIKRNYMSSK